MLILIHKMLANMIQQNITNLPFIIILIDNSQHFAMPIIANMTNINSTNITQPNHAQQNSILFQIIYVYHKLFQIQMHRILILFQIQTHTQFHSHSFQLTNILNLIINNQHIPIPNVSNMTKNNLTNIVPPNTTQPIHSNATNLPSDNSALPSKAPIEIFLSHQKKTHLKFNYILSIMIIMIQIMIVIMFQIIFNIVTCVFSFIVSCFFVLFIK